MRRRPFPIGNCSPPAASANRSLPCGARRLWCLRERIPPIRRPLEELVLKVHPAAKIFRSRTELLGWTDALSGEAISIEEIRAQKVAAFCGIGNPRAFFADLRRWGFSLVAEDAFPDHHVYTGEEIQRLVATAPARTARPLC